jgi:excisionase family DNA binding protein
MALTNQLYTDILTVLEKDGHESLARRLRDECGVQDDLTTTQVAKILGVSSVNTIKNWLEGGAFPGAYKTPGGHWRFPRHEVQAVSRRMKEIQSSKTTGDIDPRYDPDTEYAEPPLL